MRARHVLGSLLALLVLLAGGPAGAAGPYPPPTSPSATVDPGRVSYGECATFSGSGFEPGETVVITLDGQPIGSTTADAQGRFSYRYCPTSSTRPGRHVLGARGSVSGRFASASVMVVGVAQTGSRPVGGPTTDGAGGGSASGGGPLALTGLPLLAVSVAGTALVFVGSVLLVLAELRSRRRRVPAGRR